MNDQQVKTEEIPSDGLILNVDKNCLENYNNENILPDLPPKLKNMLDSYKNDMELLKITNPTAYEMQKKMEMHDYMLMKKKIELNTFLEKNQKIYKNQKSDKKIIE